MVFQFNPQLILVSAGYDAALGCPEVGYYHHQYFVQNVLHMTLAATIEVSHFNSGKGLKELFPTSVSGFYGACIFFIDFRERWK